LFFSSGKVKYHEKDKTFIRPTEYTDPKPCQLIYGVDANALYLWSIMQKMPTGSMSVPDTSLEFVDGVGVSAKSVHR
jgi:hypothetical protein